MVLFSKSTRKVGAEKAVEADVAANMYVGDGGMVGKGSRGNRGRLAEKLGAV